MSTGNGLAPAPPFELAAPAQIVFGAGTVAGLGALARAHGGHALIVIGRSTARATTPVRLLENAGVRATIFSVVQGSRAWRRARAEQLAAAAGAAGCELVVGFGGGSALDAAKAIAALLGNGGDPLDYLEVVGRGRPLVRPSLPFIAVPTTAGTGSEVTKYAVLASSEHGVKASLRSPLLLARAAIVDPDLLEGLPASVIASSGLDALSQLVEPFLSVRANPFSDGLAREGIRRSAGALGRAYAAARAGGQVAPADRGALALASLFGGLCLANAGLGAVHGFAAPLGGLFAAPHGALCAALLVPVLAGQPRGPACPRARRRRARPLRRAGGAPHRAAAGDRGGGDCRPDRALWRAGGAGPRARRRRPGRRSRPCRQGARRQQYEGEPRRADRRRAG